MVLNTAMMNVLPKNAPMPTNDQYATGLSETKVVAVCKSEEGGVGAAVVVAVWVVVWGFASAVDVVLEDSMYAVLPSAPSMISSRPLASAPTVSTALRSSSMCCCSSGGVSFGVAATGDSDGREGRKSRNEEPAAAKDGGM